MLLAVAFVPLGVWWFFGESYLSETRRERADVLIIEGWTREDGALAGAAEFRDRTAGYRWIVAAGALTGEPWNRERWHEVDIVGRALRRAGIPPERFISAEAADVPNHRTFQAALAARDTLLAHGIRPTAINVLTRGAHARRSQLTFAHVFGRDVRIGVIAWLPPGYQDSRWWESSERATDLLKETVGFLYEAVLRSGRIFRRDSSSSSKSAMPPTLQQSNSTW